MSGPLETAGVAHEPTQYAPLSMDRYITGMWTQRSPLRDAAVPYLYGKFYGASRFDSLIDGLNREITAKLTFQRRPGLIVYNPNPYPPMFSFYSFKFIQNNVQQVVVLGDSLSQVWDVTAGQLANVSLFSKPAGAGRTRFLGVGTQLIMTNDLQQMKWTQSSKVWQPNTQYNGGDFIVDPTGNIQEVISNAAASVQVSSIQVISTGGASPHFVLQVNWTTPSPQWTVGGNVQFAGMTNFVQLNGQRLPYDPNIPAQFGLPPLANGTYFFFYGPVTGGVVSDSGFGGGRASNGGISGSASPLWAGTPGGRTTDGTVTWMCQGLAVQNLSLAGPTAAPILNTPSNLTYWQPLSSPAAWYPIFDANENIEVVSGVTNYGRTGSTQPIWSSNFESVTQDGNIVFWTNCGNLGSWSPYTYFFLDSAILDSNGNLQICSTGAPVGAPPTVPSTSGATAPVWGTTVGAVVSDGDLFWTCAGPGTVLCTGGFQYAYSYHCVDGSITTASPAAVIPNGILGPAGGFSVNVIGNSPADPQCDQIWIWRTDQGGAVMVFRASIPNPIPGNATSWTFVDTDPTSAALNPLIAAPLNAIGANNQPPVGATAPEYHLQRVWMISNGSQVIWSGGPDTVVGNGLTAFPGNNVMQFPEKLTRLVSSVTNDALLLVFGTANVYAILGTGTAAEPFYPVVYMKNLGVLNYDAIAVVGSTFYFFTNNQKGAELDPGAGYVEYGFPIGDQFQQMSTGGFEDSLFDPATTYVTWHEKKSGDTALYVADGSVGWFRYSPVAPPETGFLWSPFAAIVSGTSAVQSVEVATGQWELLVGPNNAGSRDIKEIQIIIGFSSDPSENPLATITLTLDAPLVDTLIEVVLNGLTTVPALNGQTFVVVGYSGNRILLNQAKSLLNEIAPAVPETGTVSYSAGSGPILMRDTSVFTDNGKTYGEGNCYGVLGNVVLCQTGEVAEVAHIELDSILTGDRPQVGMLYDEIAESATISFDMLDYTSVDPPTLSASETLYSDRYVTSQDGECPKCTHCQILISWPDQAVGDELLSHAIYGAKYGERKEQPG